jgi:lysophospholipase L1-like esterase
VIALLVSVAVVGPFDKWETEVAAVEARPKPAAGGVVFAGSSSVRLWDLKKSFPDLAAANVGFGGSTVPACTHFAGRLVVPLKPRAVVFYAGDNDIAEGRTGTQVADDFAAFCKVVHAELPGCRVLFLAVKPSVARWKLYDVQTDANDRVKALAEADRRVGYIDTVRPLLGADGKPDPALFQKDGLHLNAAGYAKWAPLVAAAVSVK